MSEISKEQKNTLIKKRRVTISSKRQITIPAKYFEELGLSKELDCICSNGMLILIPTRYEDPAIAEGILADLISQGYSGNKLLSEFKRINRQIRPVIEQYIEEANSILKEASDHFESVQIDDFEED